MLIRTKNLVKTFGNKTVIDHLNLEVEEGKLLAYIGTNGAGKSTTMKMLTGLLKPTSGEIELSPDLKIGMVFQDSVLDAELSVLDNLKSRQSLYRNRDKSWMEKLIHLTGIEDFLNQAYGTLSGGQRRRVDIVRALLTLARSSARIPPPCWRERRGLRPCCFLTRTSSPCMSATNSKPSRGRSRKGRRQTSRRG